MKEMKVFVNGQEIKLPFDLVQMFNQMISPQGHGPKKPIPGPVHQQVMRKIVGCKELEARKVIMDMNRRLMELEKVVGKRKTKKSPEDKPKTTPKIKPKKVDKTKSPSKLKKNEKKGSKKVKKKSKK